LPRRRRSGELRGNEVRRREDVGPPKAITAAPSCSRYKLSDPCPGPAACAVGLGTQLLRARAGSQAVSPLPALRPTASALAITGFGFDPVTCGLRESLRSLRERASAISAVFITAGTISGFGLPARSLGQPAGPPPIASRSAHLNTSRKSRKMARNNIGSREGLPWLVA
jgi:hypothetical protein